MTDAAAQKRISDAASMSPLVRTGRLKKGDVSLLHAKFRELDRDQDGKIQWQEFEWGRRSLPVSIQRPLEDVFEAHHKRDISFAQFINVVGPVYLEFSTLEREPPRHARLQKPEFRWRSDQC